MPRVRPLVRQWNLLKVLSQHTEGLSIDEMAKETNVNPRTIHRDLSLFVDAGIPLRESISVRNKKYWYVDKQGFGTLGRASSEECLALLLAHLILQPFSDTRMYQALTGCRDKALAAISPESQQRARSQIATLINVWTDGKGGTLDLSQLDALWNWLLGRAGAPSPHMPKRDQPSSTDSTSQ